jgi:hypothetical protein
MAQDIQSQITRAVRALLIADGAGSAVDTIAAPSELPRSLPITTVTCGDGDPFDGPGNQKFRVTLDLLDEAATQPDESSNQASRVAANERLTNIVNALTKSDDDHTLYYTAAMLTTLGRALAVDETSGADADVAQRALDNVDMAAFTVLWWESMGVGAAGKSSGDTGAFWQRELMFSCVACSAAL